MKKIILFTSCLTFLLAGCSVGNVSRSRGLESESCLQFVQGGNTVYRGGVEVYIDDNPVFIAKVDKIKKQTVKGTVYAIKNGTRHLKIVYKGVILFDKAIVVATQETKQIKLP